jgi:hypothetical protein
MRDKIKLLSRGTSIYNYKKSYFNWLSKLTRNREGSES